MDALTAFLRRAAAEPFAFGEWDCAMTLANWVRLITGADPAPHLRRHYRTHLGWRRIVKREGGLVALVGGIAEGAGLRAIGAYRPGDVAVIDVPTVGEAGAIRTERRWVLKFAGGMVGIDHPPSAAWGIR